MLKRLIEVALPLKEVSEQSAREKSIRHGHISTLHIWWARRPLAACRAAVFASLIPDADDPECPEGFRTLVMETLDRNEFIPKNGDGSAIEDTPRNRCLEFIKLLVRWENSNKPEYIDPARKLIAAAHTFLHPGADGDAPKVLDPFAGGGAIPLEALRLGCEAHAIDINPVAHLIELCTLVYPQQYGQPDSRPVPNYIKQLIAHNRTKRKAKGKDRPLLKDDGGAHTVEVSGDETIPDVEITEAEYRKNPLAADVKYWGHWALEKVSQQVREYYPSDADGGEPVGYLWARTVTCPNPACRKSVPLLLQSWLCNKPHRRSALRILASDNGQCTFQVVSDSDIDFDPGIGTIRRGHAECPFCQTTISGEDLRVEAKAGRMGQQMTAVITTCPPENGKRFRTASQADVAAFQNAIASLDELRQEQPTAVPNEPITPDRPSPNSRGLSAIVRYGMDNFGSLFNPRQALALVRFAHCIGDVHRRLDSDPEYGQAIASLLSLALGRLADYSSSLCRWVQDFIANTFGRQAIPMIWDYCESVPIGNWTGNWAGGVEWIQRNVEHLSIVRQHARVYRASATRCPIGDNAIDALITDPPYYDAVPYSDLSDFFYVWHKRAIGQVHRDLFRTPLTPKTEELIAYYGTGKRKVQKPPEWYEARMYDAFVESRRILRETGVACVMFAHKTTSAWEAIISGLLRAGIIVTSSWPLHTERATRMVAHNAAALASSITLVCRRRAAETGDGLWDDVRIALKEVAKERLDFFWNQNIRGADFFISAIGPALSVFGKYQRVTKLSGEEVTVGQFLDEVRALVTNYALAKIMKTSHTGTIDGESQFYVIWRWSYADAKVPADESFKLAQALGMATETMWDRTGVLEKSGENVLAMPIAKRMKIKDLGDSEADGAPASLIDVLHRLCAFREKNDSDGMAQFLIRSGQGNNPALWVVAQAMSDILPDGDKEKQLMQGLLNQKERLEQAAEQGRLF